MDGQSFIREDRNGLRRISPWPAYLSNWMRHLSRCTCWCLWIYVFVLCALALSSRLACDWYGFRAHVLLTTGPLSGEVKSQDPIREDGGSEGWSNSSNVLECFQVHQPIWTSSGWNSNSVWKDGEVDTPTPVGLDANSCSVTLMEHSFGFSYGYPFIGYYKPPPCSFNRVTMNLTVKSRGRQFDRLAMMYLNDTEVFRTSTAEPTVDGIIWTYTKDMSAYQSLWESPQKVIFDLGNLVDDTYTGLFNTTLTATFFTGPAHDPAHLILPLSASRSASNSSSQFVLPEQNAVTTLKFPRNAHRALISISSTGQAAEEFWWGNVPSLYTSTFSNRIGDLYGFSPFRCTHLYIDGVLAGFVAPFPVIFTGGVVPALWRPIVGPGAFDLRDDYIDITPFLGLLSDGKSHVFEFKVAGLDSDGINESVGYNWVISGKVLLWLDLDKPDAITTGSEPIIETLAPVVYQQQQLSLDRKGQNLTLSYETRLKREIIVSSSITSARGTRPAEWKQTLDFSHTSRFAEWGQRQTIYLQSSGTDYSSTFFTEVRHSYDYHVDTSMTFDPTDPQTNLTIDASIGLTNRLAIIGNSYPGYEDYHGIRSDTQLQGTGHYFSSPKTKTGLSFGSTRQDLKFEGLVDEGVGKRDKTFVYERNVEAVNGTLIRDKEVFNGTMKGFVGLEKAIGRVEDDGEFVHFSPKKLLGRGPR